MNNNIHGDLIHTGNGYKTCDLYLAALFASSGCTIKSTERDGRKVYFHLENTDVLEKLKAAYFLRNCPVDALTYADNIKSLKSLCASIIGSDPKKG